MTSGEITLRFQRIQEVTARLSSNPHCGRLARYAKTGRDIGSPYPLDRSLVEGAQSF
jgi:hypothetical protein